MDQTPHSVVIGAGPGMGEAYARALLDRGDDVTLLSRSPQALVDAIGAEAGRLRAQSVDATDDAALRAVLITLDDQQPISTLVFNAVMNHAAPVTELATDALRVELSVGVIAAWTAFSTLLPRMQARGEGALFATGSGAGLNASTGFGFLSPVKAALRMLVLTLAAELADSPVYVGTVTVNALIDADKGVAPPVVAARAMAMLSARDQAEVVLTRDG